jgi:hypothetical protein
MIPIAAAPDSPTAIPAPIAANPIASPIPMGTLTADGSEEEVKLIVDINGENNSNKSKYPILILTTIIIIIY